MGGGMGGGCPKISFTALILSRDMGGGGGGGGRLLELNTDGCESGGGSGGGRGGKRLLELNTVGCESDGGSGGGRFGATSEIELLTKASLRDSSMTSNGTGGGRGGAIL